MAMIARPAFSKRLKISPATPGLAVASGLRMDSVRSVAAMLRVSLSLYGVVGAGD